MSRIALRRAPDRPARQPGQSGSELLKKALEIIFPGTLHEVLKAGRKQIFAPQMSGVQPIITASSGIEARRSCAIGRGPAPAGRYGMSVHLDAVGFWPDARRQLSGVETAETAGKPTLRLKGG